MSELKTLLMHPDFRAPLVIFGKEMPFEDIGHLLGGEPYSVAGFSDYAGDSRGVGYEVFATYVVDWNGLSPLVQDLQSLRTAMGGRTMDFKGRKDRIKSPHLEPWLGAFQRHAGLCIAVCFDKRGLSFPQSHPAQKALKAALKPFGISAAVGLRMVRALSFLPVIGHLLRERDRFLWISDHDAVLDGAAGRELPKVLQAMGNQVVGKKLTAFGYCKPLDDAQELILTLPDLIAGTLASSIPHPFESGPTKAPDDEAARILLKLAKFADPYDSTAQGTRLIVIHFRADMTEQVMHPRVLSLSGEPGPVQAALLRVKQ